MDVLKFYQDHHIDHVTQHKNVRDGFVGIHCPFCVGKQEYHLGYSLDDNYFNCWRCGSHSAVSVVRELLDLSYNQAIKTIEKYGGEVERKPGEARKKKAGTTKFQFPVGEIKIYPAHIRYLQNRGYDPHEIIKQWNLTGTGNIAYLDGINMSRRLLAPIEWEGEVVSFQTRDITGKNPAKYITCPPEREIIHHKHILYGKFSDRKKRKRGICVEGITDVWRLGPDAFATFGIKYTHKQMCTIAKYFEEIIIIFDQEKQAQKQARKLREDLQGKGLRMVDIKKIKGDPGAMRQREADEMMRYLMR